MKNRLFLFFIPTSNFSLDKFFFICNLVGKFFRGVSLKRSESEIRATVEKAVNQNKVISVKTYFLTDYGEFLLKVVCENVLTRFNRMDLMEICYSSAKELVINATKANVKRVLFKKRGLDINNPKDYEKGLVEFKANLSEDKIVQFKDDFVKYNFPVTATFYYSKDVMNIKVKNNFPLLPLEEERIRDKFKKATSFASLIDFFMEYGDSTEGAGMGLTMVGILLDQSGINKHSFSLYSSEKYNETVAKIEIPLSPSYIPKREVFEMEMKKKGITAEELRKVFSYNYKHFDKFAEEHLEE